VNFSIFQNNLCTYTRMSACTIFFTLILLETTWRVNELFCVLVCHSFYRSVKVDFSSFFFPPNLRFLVLETLHLWKECCSGFMMLHVLDFLCYLISVALMPLGKQKEHMGMMYSWDCSLFRRLYLLASLKSLHSLLNSNNSWSGFPGNQNSNSTIDLHDAEKNVRKEIEQLFFSFNKDCIGWFYYFLVLEQNRHWTIF